MAKTTIKNRYGTVPNDLLNNDSISFKAKGMYAYIQSKPDNWDFSVEKISFQSKESTEAISSGLRELETFGYLHRVRFQNTLGHWEVEYILYSEPTDHIRGKEGPDKENPDTGDNPNNSKKDLSKKDNSNKDKDIISRTISLLNKYSNSNYKPTSLVAIKTIKARLAEGFTETDLSLVVVSKSNQWLKDPKMSAYLRPETLFGNKFEGYLNESLRAAAKPKGTLETIQDKVAAAAATSEFNQK